MNPNDYFKLSDVIRTDKATLEDWMMWADVNGKWHPARTKVEKMLAQVDTIIKMCVKG